MFYLLKRTNGQLCLEPARDNVLRKVIKLLSCYCVVVYKSFFCVKMRMTSELQLSRKQNRPGHTANVTNVNNNIHN